MAYVSGAITSATPATALVNAIEAELTAHGNWIFVEEVVIGAYTRRVWRNTGDAANAAANSFGQDFFIELARATDGTGSVWFYAFEQYKPSTDTTYPARAIRPCVPNTSGLAPNTNYSFGDETAGFTLDNGSIVSAWLPTDPAGFDWFLNLTNNRLIVATKYSTVDYAVYVGLFQSMVATEPFPLCIIGTNGQESMYLSDIGVSRHPGRTAAATYNFVFQLRSWTMAGGNAQLADPMHGGAVASRLHLSPIYPDATYGWIRGLLYDCFWLPDGGTVTRNGDTLTIGAETWTKFKFGTYGAGAGAWVRNAAA